MNAPLSSVAEPPQSDLDQLANDELHATARQLVCGSNQLLATLLAHLGEIEARGIHRERACSSLYTYCIYELRMSEDAAYRRARAARLVRAYPAALRAIADGELHLTGLLLLAPHLSEENHEELLALAKHRSKREILALVRRIAPEPEMAPKLEPIGRALGLVPRAPTWKQFVTALCPPVRELDPGARPKDWTIATDGTEDHGAPREALGAPRAHDETRAGAGAADHGAPVPSAHDETRASAGAAADSADETAPAEGAPAGSATGSAGSSEADADAAATERAPGMPPLRYKVQFTASQRYAELVERACDLLSHAVPSRSLEEVHLRAMELLVTQLEKRKYGAPPRADAPSASNHATQPRPRAPIPAAVRRQVFDRDGGRCTHVDPRGQRCRETSLLELHHREPHARGGPDSTENLTLRCRAHNALAAERDFGLRNQSTAQTVS